MKVLHGIRFYRENFFENQNEAMFSQSIESCVRELFKRADQLHDQFLPVYDESTGAVAGTRVESNLDLEDLIGLKLKQQ